MAKSIHLYNKKTRDSLKLHPVLQGIVWPVMPGSMAAVMLAMLYQLEESQWLTPGEIWQNQLRQLQLLWGHAFATVPYYQETLQAAGLDREVKFFKEIWQQVPVLSRKMLQQHEQKLLSRKIPREHGQTNLIQSSGSTGRPVRVTRTELTNLLWKIFTIREHLWHKRDFSGKMAAIRYAQKGKSEYPGVHARNWGPATHQLTETGHSVTLNSNTDIAIQAKWLMEQDPDYLLTYPSNLSALAKHFLDNGYSLNKLKEVRSFGEALGSEVRDLCQEAWNVSLVDGYSTQEIGLIAFQCPERAENYHIQSEINLVEIVNEDGIPCKEGETGRVLVTNLHNFAMPLLRYEVGDFAEVGAACPCGRGLPVLKRILGRVRNMITLPSGQKKWPDFASRHYADIAPIQQFQMIQKTLETLEMRLVVSEPMNKEQEKRLAEVVRNALGYPFVIGFSYLDEIPRSASGKFEEFLSEVA